tara:strand:- start:336 stop:725 length:390 start_codon:yes stop_codon:yes gene_type:complete
MLISFSDIGSNNTEYKSPLPYIKGKALLVITKLDSKYVPFEVNAYIQSCNGDEICEDSALETFQLLETDTLPLPNAAYKLSVGQTVRVSVVYQIEFSQDYFGESDVDMWYHKEKVLRKQFPKERYLTKS